MSASSPIAVRAIEMECVERDVRRELAARALTETERVLMDLFIRYSLACGKQSAFIPTQRDLVALSGLSSGHVSDGVASLARKGLVMVDASRHLYTVMPDPRGWVFARSRHRSLIQEQRARHLDRLLTAAALSEQYEHVSLAPEPDLSTARRDVSWERVLAGEASHGTEARGQCSPLGAPGVPAPDGEHRVTGPHVPDHDPEPVNDRHVPDMRRLAAGEGDDVDQELLDAVRKVLGEQFEGKAHVWRLRFREHPGSLRLALGNLKQRLHSTRLAAVRNPAAWLTDEFFRIVNKGVPGKRRSPCTPLEKASASREVRS